MIDFEADIYARVTAALRSSYNPIYISNEETRMPSKFPFTSIVEIDNYAYRRTMDSGSNERHAQVVFEVTVASNKTTGRKAECKAILSDIDEIFTGIGFTRTMTNPVPMEDATIFKLVARYSAIIDESGRIYNRR